MWKRLPVIGPFQVEVDQSTAFTYVSASRDAIGRALFWKGIHGEWEAETIPVFQEYARHASVVLDIGANTGFYSLLACSVNTAASVHAFEPVPKIYELLRHNIEANGFEDRYEPHAVAVSSHDGEVEFHVPYADVPTSASMHAEGFRGVAGHLMRIASVTIDSVAASIGRIDLCEIDVEGFEDSVLEGMSRTLAHDEPAIVFECNPDGPYGRVESILKSYEYDFFQLGSNGPRPVISIVPDPSGKSRDFLAVKRASDTQQAYELGEHPGTTHS